MRAKLLAWLLVAACISLTAAPRAMAALAPLIVQHNPLPGNFGTIQAAINQATNLHAVPANATAIITIQVDPGTYTESFTPTSNLEIAGASTAGTFLSSSAMPINLNGVQNVTIRNFTFQTASVVGISVTRSSSIDIINDVFNLGTSGTAIQIQNSPSTLIVNNTFAFNGTAVSTDSIVNITNDIFFRNNKAIATGTTPTLSFDYFFGNNDNGLPIASLGTGSIPNPQVPTAADPLFITPTNGNGDFHLQTGSPAANAGNHLYPNSFNHNTFDMGAYGGPFADILVPITDLTSSLTTSTITLNWTAISAVTAYRVYYGTTSRFSPSFLKYDGSQATEGLSPFTVTTNSATLSGLPLTVPASPAAPTLTSVTPLDNALQVSWTPVDGATKYRIFYGTTQFDPTNPPTTPTPIDVDGTLTSFPIHSLTNGTPYFVAVAALTESRFFAAVTAVIDPNIASNPGSPNESSFSNETSQVGAQSLPSVLSNVISESPAPTSPFPNLKNEGCFIATAAFGFYSAPQVQVLRDFRDRYLLTNAPGRAFVAWYYHYGPVGAHFINAHPWLKPPVRLALLPLVVGSFFLLHTSPFAKIAIILFAIAGSTFLFKRIQCKMLAHSGGIP